MNKNKKLYSELQDLETGELVVSAELTLAAVKRFMKHYKSFGVYTKATHGGIEVSA